MKKALLPFIFVLIAAATYGVPPEIVNITTTDVTCNGGADGSVVITISGGVAPYSFSLVRNTTFVYNSPPVNDTVYTFNNVESFRWVVYIEDANGDPVVDIAPVDQPEPVTITPTNVVPISCTGYNDGQISVTASGESGSYIFTLNPGGATDSTGLFTNLSPGNYTVTVNDAGGCPSSDITDILPLSDPDPITIPTENATDLTCNGKNDGTVNVTASGGTGSYTYTLTPGLQTNGSGSFSGLGPGIYTVEATDDNNCPAGKSNPLTVNEPPAVQITSENKTDISCYGASDGSITITASGGKAPYEFILDPGSVSSSTGQFKNLAPGNYTVRVFDGNSCGPVFSNTIVINQPDELAIVSVVPEDVTCHNAGNGIITVTATGGTAPLTYTLYPGGISNNDSIFNGLAGGTYAVEVDDAGSCPPVTSDSVTIHNPPAISIDTESKTNVTCNGASDGTITITASGGTGTLHYTLDPGNVTNTTGFFSSLGPGVYTVSVTDDNNCAAAVSKQQKITEPTAITILSETATDITCTGDADGRVRVTVTGGTPPYHFTLNPSGTVQAGGNFTGLQAGTYTVTVTDGGGCDVSSSALKVNEPAPLSLNLVSSSAITCNGNNDGEIHVAGSGGTAPLSYTLNPGAVTKATGDFTGLAGGNYTVTLSDANACPEATIDTVEIVDPPVISIDTGVKTNVTCNGASDGTITITASGGTGTLHYTLDPGNVTNTTGFFSSLGPGDYTVSVTDDNNCAGAVSSLQKITEPTAITILSENATDITCTGDADGQVMVTATGGTPPYQFILQPSGKVQADGNFTGLQAGTYTVTVTDDGGCDVSSSALKVNEPAPLSLSLVSSSAITCNGNNDGEIHVTGSGGTAPLSYTLNPGAVTKATGDFTGLAGGNYTVTLSDANACPEATIDTVEIVDPPVISITSVDKTDVSCHGAGDGSVRVVATGGTGILHYTLNPGAVSNTTGVFEGLQGDAYTITVTDDNACGPVSTGPVEIIDPVPADVTVEATSKLVLNCNNDSDGSVDITVTGGTAPYLYSWSGAGGFSSSSEDIHELSAGTYNLTVTDASGCTGVFDSIAEVTEPPVLDMSLTATDNNCYGDTAGSITVTAQGGTAPYEYSRNGISYQASKVFSNLFEKTYTIYVRDAGMCTTYDTITVDAPGEVKIGSVMTVNGNKCYGDSLGEIRIMDVTGGVEPYLYSINDGTDFHSSADFQQLGAGTYQIVVKDDHDCTIEGGDPLITQPSAIKIISYAQADVTGCFDNDNGQIAIEAAGGTGKKTYQLDLGSPNTSGLFKNVSGGDHTITITDTNQCSIDTVANLNRPAGIVVTSLIFHEVTGCSGDSNGSIEVSAAGGTGPLQYAIDGGSLNASGMFNGLTAGDHTISVVDSTGCTRDSIVNLGGPAPVTIASAGATDVSCAGYTNGTLTVTPAGGTTPYSYTLSPGGTTNSTGIFNGLTPGSYTVEVDDTQGCGPVTSDTLIIGEPLAIAVDSVLTSEISCAGSNNAQIHVYATGGTGPYQYSIDDEANWYGFRDFTGLTPGTYHLSLKDANNCKLPVDTITFDEPAPLTVVAQSSTDVTTCFGDQTGSLTYELTGGTGNIEYSLYGIHWQTTGTFDSLVAGTYQVMTRDANGCSNDSPDILIDGPAEITATVTTIPGPDEGMGSLIISDARGGTGTLSFSVNGQAGPFTAETDYPNIDPGFYDVIVMDENACTWEQSVQVSAVPPLTVTVTSTNVSCFGAGDGSISMNATDATGQAAYSIDDSTTWQNDGTFSGLDPGTYILFTRDEDDRYFSDTVVISGPVALSLYSNISPATCTSFTNDGSIDMTLSGAADPVTWSWSNGAATEDLNNLPPGEYVVTATDANGCSATDTMEVTAMTTVIAHAGADTTVCPGTVLTLNGKGGTEVSWHPAAGLSDPDMPNPTVTVDTSVTYIFTAVGMNDCYGVDTITISAYAKVELSAGRDTLLNTDQIQLNAEGGPFVSYRWTPPQSLDDSASATPVAAPVVSTTYVVSAVTEDGCVVSDTVTISKPGRLVIYNAFSPNGDGVNDFWDIDNATEYPGIIVEVFNRWGEKIFSSRGYSDDKRWDGTYNGKEAPLGTYYYVVVPYSGAEALTGPLTIVR